MGDSIDGIPGIPRVGPKTADEWLEYEQPVDMPAFVLNKYIEKFGFAAGISKFAETFKLVYILKDRSDVRREVDMELNPPTFHEVNINKHNDEWV